MKHHGNYHTITPEEVLLNSDDVEYVYKELDKKRKKAKNTKRHKEKRKSYKYKKYE